jgi:hypothetical protein
MSTHEFSEALNDAQKMICWLGLEPTFRGSTKLAEDWMLEAYVEPREEDKKAIEDVKGRIGDVLAAYCNSIEEGSAKLTRPRSAKILRPIPSGLITPRPASAKVLRLASAPFGTPRKITQLKPLPSPMMSRDKNFSLDYILEIIKALRRSNDAEMRILDVMFANMDVPRDDLPCSVRGGRFLL